MRGLIRWKQKGDGGEAGTSWTVTAEPAEFSEGLVVGRKFKRKLKRDSGILGLSPLKVKRCPLQEALSRCPLGPSGALEG